MIVPSIISWWGTANCISGSWTATNMRQGLWYRETLGLKHITGWTALDLEHSCYKRSSTLTVRKPYKQHVVHFRSKKFIFEERSHRRTTVEHKWNINFILVPTVSRLDHVVHCTVSVGVFKNKLFPKGRNQTSVYVFKSCLICFILMHKFSWKHWACWSLYMYIMYMCKYKNCVGGLKAPVCWVYTVNCREYLHIPIKVKLVSLWRQSHDQLNTPTLQSTAIFKLNNVSI